MPVAKITSKGQITLPKEVRDRMGLKAGDEVSFVEIEGIYQLRRKIDPKVFEKWSGYLKDLEGQDVDELIREMRGDDYRP